MTKGQLADNVLHVYSTVQKSGSHWEIEQPCQLTLRKYLYPLNISMRGFSVFFQFPSVIRSTWAFGIIFLFIFA